MKKLQHHSGNSLFLMEMILALLFLSLSCAACIQVFAAARSNRLRAQQLNQIQALTTSMGEALEGTDGSNGQILSLLPNGSRKSADLVWYYDAAWQNCEDSESAYEMVFTPATSSQEKSGSLTFYRTTDHKELYQINLSFPAYSEEKEDSR